MQLKANGITLEVHDHHPEQGGETAPPLILVRGLGSQLVHWPDALIDGFVAAGFRTITFDNRDTGLSQRCPAPGVPDDPDEIAARLAAGDAIPPAYTLHDMADDVVALMDALNIPAAHVFGISMGGGITQDLALRHPGRLLSATLVMTAARRPDARPGGSKALNRLLVRDVTVEQAEDNLIAEHAAFGSPGYPMPEADIRAQARAAHARGMDAAGINRQLLATLAGPDRRAALGAITTPCLVIHGADDALIPLEAGTELAAHIPESEFHAIPGMGHIITPLLAPEIVALVADFIARRTEAPG